MTQSEFCCPTVLVLPRPDTQQQGSPASSQNNGTRKISPLFGFPWNQRLPERQSGRPASISRCRPTPSGTWSTTTSARPIGSSMSRSSSGASGASATGTHGENRGGERGKRPGFQGQRVFPAGFLANKVPVGHQACSAPPRLSLGSPPFYPVVYGTMVPFYLLFDCCEVHLLDARFLAATLSVVGCTEFEPCKSPKWSRVSCRWIVFWWSLGSCLWVRQVVKHRPAPFFGPSFKVGSTCRLKLGPIGASWCITF